MRRFFVRILLHHRLFFLWHALFLGKAVGGVHTVTIADALVSHFVDALCSITTKSTHPRLLQAALAMILELSLARFGCIGVS